MKSLRDLMGEHPDELGEINILIYGGRVQEVLVTPDFPGTSIQVERAMVFDTDVLTDEDVIIYPV